jgi:hypothetical protein
MIALAKACEGGGALANYVINPKKGYELSRNLLCGNSPKEIIEEFKMIQQLNQRAINKTFSLVLSPDISDTSKITDDDLCEMVEEFLDLLLIDKVNQSWVSFVHTEKHHKHIHIISNRVQPNGELISDHRIGKRAQWAAHQIAVKRNLTSAKDKMIHNIKAKERVKEIYKELKHAIYDKHLAVLLNIPKDFEEYQREMKKLGVLVVPSINSKGLVQGHRMIDIASKNEFKASEINRNLGLIKFSDLIKGKEKIIVNLKTHKKNGFKL